MQPVKITLVENDIDGDGKEVTLGPFSEGVVFENVEGISVIDVHTQTTVAFARNLGGWAVSEEPREYVGATFDRLFVHPFVMDDILSVPGPAPEGGIHTIKKASGSVGHADSLPGEE